MAAPSGQMKVTRYFAVLAVIIAGLYALVFFLGDKKPTPKLGLDLKGGTSLTLKAVTPTGKDPSSTALNQAREIIANRVNASGVSEPDVVTAGTRNIVVSVAGGASEDEMRQLVAPAQLAFRKVLSTAQDNPAAASPSPSVSGSASASTSAKPSASASASATPKTSASATPKASATPSASASASAGAAGASASATPSLNPSLVAAAAQRAQTLEEVKAKLGSVYDLAGSIQDPTQIDPSTLAALAPFSKLTANEVDALPVQYQFLVPTVTCAQLNAREPGSIEDPNTQVVACDQGENVHTKYVLDVAKVQGTDVKSADYSYDTQNGGWHVTLSFTGKGQSKWTDLTREAMQNAQSNSGSSSQGGAQVAIVLDNEVVSAPQIQSVIVGDAIINGGNINQQTAKTLATQLKYGSLPLNFKIESIQAISATLGLQQMKYGLLAGAIGILLVVVYCLIYYRALGLVVIASLCVSGVTIFALLVLLGRSLGFTLTLAGIAGFIVAIGITADSFVVFFERLKDEVKDGRTVRSSVPRAWIRARRTILSADAVSLLAAVVLYLFAAGDVKGFAFTLGMSTIIDLVVVFLFTHPLVSLLARSPAFTAPRVSGLGNMRSDAAIESGGRTIRLGTMRTKES